MKNLAKFAGGGVCFLLILLLSVVSSGIALANESSIQAYMSLAATSLDITISESISMSNDGATENLTVSDLVVKSNMDLGVVKVTDISVNEENGWTLVKKGTDFISMNADSQQIYLGYSTHDFSKGSLKMNDFKVAPGESKALSLSGKTGPLKTDITNEKVATVVMTAELAHITWVDLGGDVGEVAVENGDDLQFELNEETGEIIGTSKEIVEEIPAELPEEALPELIEFTGGYFDSISNYTPGTYETVEYETTHTGTKYPARYGEGVCCKWLSNSDGIVSKQNATLEDFSDLEERSTYIVYNIRMSEASLQGVTSTRIVFYSIFEESDDTLENAIYLAAYLKETGDPYDSDIAMWNGTQYVDINKQEEIAAIDTFTETYTVTSTKEVKVSEPSSSTQHVYIPVETMKAEKEMTWEEWLCSSYNLTGLTGSEDGFTIKDSDYNDIALTAEIKENASYAIYINQMDPGLYNAEGTMLASWDELVNDYGMDVEIDYNSDSTQSNYYKTTASSPYVVLTNNFPEASTLVMGDGVTKIGNYAFYGGFALTFIEVPEGVTSIGKCAFDGCEELTSFKVPASVTSIGELAFRTGTAMKSIIVDEANTAYYSEGGVLFNKDKTSLIAYPTGLAGSYIIPETVTDIALGAFSHCKTLTSIVLLDGVTSIGDGAFVNCANLTSLKLPDSVTSIGDLAFFGCDNVTTIRIPANIVYDYISQSSLLKGASLLSIEVDESSAKYSSEGGVLFDKDKTGILDYPKGLSGSYVIPDSVSSITEAAFNNCKKLTALEIPASVTRIGHSGIANCTSLETITYKGTTTQWSNISINSDAFSGTLTDTVNCTDGSVTIKNGCFAEGTLITLADGTEKVVEEITYEDKLLAWDLNSGSYAVTTPSLIESHEETECRVINLQFEDGTLIRIIEDHGFFDVSENNFVFLDEANVNSYVGHKFVKAGEGGSNEAVKLTGYHITTEKVSYYTIQTAVYNNCVAEGMLTLTSPPEGFDGWFDYFTIGEGMKYDEAKKQADIEKYGLYSYEDFAAYVTYEQFLAFNGPYLKVLVGRGVLTYDDILSIITTYLS